jgi:NTE family protein
MKCDIVAEGGGSKIGGHVGAYAALVNRGFTLSHAGGSSSGAIISAMAIAGYTPTEMKTLLSNTDFNRFLDGSRFKTKRIWDLFNQLGMHPGEEFYRWIKEQLESKGIKEFGDLISSEKEDQINQRYRWRLKVTASDISNGRLLTFPDDSALFNIEPDKLEVAYAVRMSMSLPLFFRPVKFQSSYILDGGLLSSFPIWMFDSDGTPEWPTFGLLLKEDDFGETYKTDGLADFLLAVLKTMLNAHDRRFVRPEDYIHRTIAIPTVNISTTNFNLSTAEKETLYHNGYKAATQFLDSWSWSKYRNWSKKVRGVR